MFFTMVIHVLGISKLAFVRFAHRRYKYLSNSSLRVGLVVIGYSFSYVGQFGFWKVASAIFWCSLLTYACTLWISPLGVPVGIPWSQYGVVCAMWIRGGVI